MKKNIGKKIIQKITLEELLVAYKVGDITLNDTLRMLSKSFIIE